jgi:hypothetical protein
MNEEIASIEKNDTWRLVPRPKKKRVLKERWRDTRQC